MARNKAMNYAEKMRLIRPFVSFNYDIKRKTPTAAQKRKITHYFNEIYPVIKNAADYHIYKPRTRKNVKAAHEIMPAFKGMGEMRNFPIPKPVGQKVRISVKKGKAFIKSDHVTSEFIPLNAQQLADDPAATVKRAIRGKKHKRYSIAAGEAFEIPSTFDPDLLPEKVAEYVARYTIDPTNPDQVTNPADKKNKSKNHDFRRWLKGIYGYSFDNQANLTEYRSTRKKQKRRNRGKKGKSNKRSR